MRIVDEASKLKAAVASAKREAASAFGDATVFLERYLNGARHVEIQVIGDSHGNLVHCFERECSIQRRHQKIIEEAPSSAVTPELRERMGQAGIQAVRAINYENAGTVEFLLDSSGEFFFLEVNTRLQVEHPVTEEITGLDLVREQIRVAQGLPLSFTQESLEINGHAIEARIYAEDPANDFLPATGEVLAWEMPTTPEARYDSGVASGSTVSVNFDPMLAKVTAHAATREEAALRLGRVLERMRIQGVITNRDFLITVLRHPRFLAGDTTTSFIEEVNPSRERTLSEAELRNKAIAASLFIQHRNRSAADVLRTLPSGFRITRMPPERNTFVHRDREILTEYSSRRDGDFNFTVLGETTTARIMAVSDDCLEYAVNGRRMTTTAHNHGNQWWLHDADGDISLTLKTRFPESNALEAVAGGLISPMPGTVIAVQVASGEQVSAGQVLAIIEAMKMEHSVVSPHDGLVSEVRVAIGDKVEGGELLVVVDDDSGES
jgi:propionyl-CoA carboxylase alpha chain